MKWYTAENESGTTTLKQHCYIEYDRQKAFYNELYNGNKVLCGKGGLIDSNENFENLKNIKSEIINQYCCKKCYKIFNKLTNETNNISPRIKVHESE